MVKVWARVVRGLEWVAAAEAEILPGTSCLEIGHRDLLFRCDEIATASQLRCVDDVFLVWSEREGLDHTRASLTCLDQWLRQLPGAPVKIPSGVRNIRVTASFLGSRNFSRYEIEDVAGHALAARLELRYVDTRSGDPADAVWCRLHMAGDHARLGIRTAPNPLHRRPWRTDNTAGAIHPPVAAAMALLADLHPGQRVLDPFAGAGTLLIEAGLQCPDLELMGYDISEEAISRARENAQRAHISADLTHADASVTALAPVDRVISNPPWGRAVNAGGQLTSRNLLKTLLGPLTPPGRAVLLADQELGLRELLEQSGYATPLVHPLRVSGRLAHLLVVSTTPGFADTDIGRALSRAAARDPDQNGLRATSP